MNLTEAEDVVVAGEPLPDTTWPEVTLRTIE